MREAKLKLYAFSSENLTNVWAGIGAELRAVAPASDQSFERGRVTKAAKMPIGAAGILYVKETGALTTPFIVYSKADNSSTITNVWPEKWVLPFRIKPLGTPHKQLSRLNAAANLAGLSAAKKGLTQYLLLQGQFAFQGAEVTETDWAYLINSLAS